MELNHKGGQEVGYIRVSSITQNTARQLDGVFLNEVFEDKISAKDVKRPGLEACLKHVRKGDRLHVHSMDRLARNNVDLQRLVKEITARGVTIKFHKEGLVFTGEDGPMQQLMLQLMGAFAEFERAWAHERQAEGIAAAKAKGKRLGRKPVLTPEQVKKIRARMKDGATPSDLAKEYGVSRASIYRAAKD